jgi:hypothetical protein
MGWTKKLSRENEKNNLRKKFTSGKQKIISFGTTKSYLVKTENKIFIAWLLWASVLVPAL